MNQYNPDSTTAPGETLLELLEDRGLTQVMLAERLGVTPKHVNEVIKGKAAISPEMALRLERVLGVRASFWNNYEAAYRDYLLRAEEAQKAESERGMLEQEPFKSLIRSMVNARYLPKADSFPALRESILKFFGVADFDQLQPVFATAGTRYRSAKSYERDPYAVMAWLQKGEWIAHTIRTKPFSREKLRDRLIPLRNLTVADAKTMQHEMERLCAEAGVALVFAPELPGTKLYGAARWITPQKALVQLSLRDRSNDRLWFSFFHEIGHILLHGKRDAFIDGEKDMNGSNEEEKEADAFASELLIRPDRLMRFINENPKPSLTAIQRFAAEINLHPGIVVGRLQHMQIIDWHVGNKLKVRYEWKEAGE